MKLKFLITSLTGCSGCISSLIASDIFPQFLERTEIIYFPFISDADSIEECDIAIIEGCVSEEKDIKLLKNIRKNSKKVFCLGTCASFGGIFSLSNEIMAQPISNYIEIDGIIPGCPPPTKLLGNSIISFIENKSIVLSTKNLCASCPLREDKDQNYDQKIEDITPKLEDIMTPDENSKCFLKRGILCLGPITREGCENKCINLGVPCDGCMGPISKDFTSNVINFLSLLKISPHLKQYEAIYYRYSKPNLSR